VEPGHHRRVWCRDCGGPAGHGGGGGAEAPDWTEKEAKQIWWRSRMAMDRERWWRRMVLGGGMTDVVRMSVWTRLRISMARRVR
jgi:hypothetical protein